MVDVNFMVQSFNVYKYFDSLPPVHCTVLKKEKQALDKLTLCKKNLLDIVREIREKTNARKKYKKPTRKKTLDFIVGSLVRESLTSNSERMKKCK